MRKFQIKWVGVLGFSIFLASCAEEAPAVDTGIHGIEVPADATVTARQTVDEGALASVDLFEADLPGWEFEEAVGWMESRLPVNASFDGMDYEEEGAVKDDEYTKSWNWSGLSRDEECHLLFVAVIDGDMGDPVIIRIADGTDISSACGE